MSDTTKTDPSLFILPAEDMRALGYRAIDMLVEHVTGLADRPVVSHRGAPPDAGAIGQPPPGAGRDAMAVLEEAGWDILGHISHIDHPRFFAYVPGANNYMSALGALLAAGFNVFAGVEPGNEGPTRVERIAIDWLRQMVGLPPGAGGLFTSGGSMANLTGLAVARHRRLGDRLERAVIYCSDQIHSSVERGARTLGFAPEQICKIAADAACRLTPAALADQIAQDRAAGRIPFALAASAGTTSTGTADPLDALADLCAREGLWLHVDAAFGGPGVLSRQGKKLLAGLERADSLSLDPHKWLFQSIDCGCVLVRQEAWLAETFRIVPDYMKDSHHDAATNYRDWSVETTRGFRALKLWLSVQTFGMDAFRAAVQRGVDLAEQAEQMLRADPDWRVMLPASLGVITFRYHRDGLSEKTLDAVTQTAITRLVDSGYAFVSSTMVGGRKVMRLCTINPRTTEADVAQTLARLKDHAREAAEGLTAD